MAGLPVLAVEKFDKMSSVYTRLDKFENATLNFSSTNGENAKMSFSC